MLPDVYIWEILNKVGKSYIVWLIESYRLVTFVN